MLYKLEHYGIRGNALDWFSSYLKNRYQYVVYENTCSSFLPIKTGVPQGSILGPLLFILYINDLHLVSSLFEFILYADDSTLLSTLCLFSDNVSNIANNKTLVQSINKEIDKIQDWLTANMLSLNLNKTKMMVFHNKQKNIEKHIPKISINGTEIERVSEFNFLGIVINENMDWSSHIFKISNKISRTIGILNRLKRFLPSGILRQIYCSLILPHLHYGILIWGFKSSKLSKLQKRAVRCITNSKYNAHSEPLLKKLNLLKIEDIFLTAVLKFYYKLINQNLPSYFLNYLPSATHSYQLRNIRPQQTRARTVNATQCLRHHLPNCLEVVPNIILQKVYSHSYPGFSICLRRHLIGNYSSVCTIEKCYVCSN